MHSIRKELDWLPFLADLPLIVPHVRFRGRADIGVMCDFAIVDWLEGEDAFPHNIDDPVEAACDLAGFLKALHAKRTTGAPLADRRGAALETLSSAVLPAIDVLADEIDAEAARKLWRSACAAAYRGPPVWLHGDLKADNLIANGGRLRAVIDWGLCAVGDPAVDYAAAWTWAEASARDIFCDACGLLADERLRAKGWALYCAVIALSYYRDRGSHDALCSQSRRTLAHLELSIGSPCDDSRGR